MAHRYSCGEKKAEPSSLEKDYKKYVPSEEIGGLMFVHIDQIRLFMFPGEYEQYKKKVSKKGGLYPLNEEGTYGPPPSALPPPLPGYKKRERKPKVYASYAISR